MVGNLVFAVVNFVILHFEIQQRKTATTIFTAKWFKIFSISCITTGTLSHIFLISRYIPGLCTFIGLFGVISSVAQFLSMGYYQLYRLYYCFANEQIHSDKGYPKWVFFVMYFGALFSCINYMIFWFLERNNHFYYINYKCSYLDNLDFYAEPIRMSSIADIGIAVIFVKPIIGGVWDITTLILYMVKLKHLKHIEMYIIVIIQKILQSFTSELCPLCIKLQF